MKYFDTTYFDFLDQLALNNERGWFKAHREIFDLAVEHPFHRFVGALMDSMGGLNPRITGTAEQAVFRIQRDMRFARGQAPYKLQRSALISEGGLRSRNVPSFYVEIGHSGVQLGGGLYRAKMSTLDRISDRFDPEELGTTFRDVYGSVRLDRREGSFTYSLKLDRDVGLRPDLLAFVLDRWQRAQPLHRFLWTLL